MCAAPDRPPAPAPAAQPPGFDVLGRAECLGLLRKERLGRLGVIHDGGVEIFPLNYAMDGECVVFRTAGGTKLDAVVRTTPVCFEIDGTDPVYHGGWSVVVHGRGEEVLRSPEKDRLADLPLRPWAEGSRDHWIRLPVDQVSGRRVVHRHRGFP